MNAGLTTIAPPVFPVEVRWHGRGGQGVVTASRLLVTAALRAGLYPQSLPDFSAERSGAPIAAYSRIGREPPWMRGPIVSPAAVVILDVTVAAATNVLDGLLPGGIVTVNTGRSPEETAVMLEIRHASVFTVDGDDISTRLLGRALPNAPLLGALIHALPVVDLATLKSTLQDEMGRVFPPKVVAGNVAALEEGYASVQSGRFP